MNSRFLAAECQHQVVEVHSSQYTGAVEKMTFSLICPIRWILKLAFVSIGILGVCFVVRM